MDKIQPYSADEIADMRNIIMASYDELPQFKNLSDYERLTLAEAMLKTYITCGITYVKLEEWFSNLVNKKHHYQQ